MPLEISTSLLKQLAGDAAYQRGAAYAREGRVSDLAKTGSKITATVNGSQAYQVGLRHTKSLLEGSCNCPASGGFDFCKHCVAVAKVYAQDLPQQADAKSTEQQRLKSYLATLDQRELVDALLSEIYQHSERRQHWQLRADKAQGLLDAKQLKKRITAVTRARSLFRRAEVRAWFNTMLPEIRLIDELEADFDSGELFKLLDYFWQRLDQGYEKVDDSGGYREIVQSALNQLHEKILLRPELPREAVYSRLLTLKLSDDYDNHSGIPEAYPQLFDERGISEFEDFCTAYWRNANKRFKQSGAGSVLSCMLSRRAEQMPSGKALPIWQSLADQPRARVRWIHCLLDTGDWQGANKALAESGESLADQQADYLHLQARVAKAQGQTDRAEKLAWQQFAASPGTQRWRQLLDLLSTPDMAFQELCRRSESGESLADIAPGVLLEILLDGKQFDLAWHWQQRRALRAVELLPLAEQSSHSHPERAFAAYQQYISYELETFGASSYPRVMSRLAEIQALFDEGRFRDYLSLLRAQFSQKTGLINRLERYFPED